MLLSQQLMAQPQDAQLRSKVGFEWNPHKKWELSASYRLDLNQNFTSFRRSNFEVGMNYDVLKWLKIGSAYRFVTSYEQDFHRFEVSLAAKQKIGKKFQVSFKTMVQRDFNYLNKEYFQTHVPDWRWRNRIALKYDITKKWNAGIFTELFSTAYPEKLYPFRLRTGFDLSYTYKKRNQFGIGYFYQKVFNDNQPNDIQVFEVEYIYKLSTWKKKKKEAELK
jgi:hypothetical protein